MLPSCEHPATNGTIFQGRTGPDAFVRHLIDLKSVRYRGFCAGDDKRDVQGDQKKEERTDKANTDTKEEVGQKKDNIEEKKETLEQEMFRLSLVFVLLVSQDKPNPLFAIVSPTSDVIARIRVVSTHGLYGRELAKAMSSYVCLSSRFITLPNFVCELVYWEVKFVDSVLSGDNSSKCSSLPYLVDPFNAWFEQSIRLCTCVSSHYEQMITVFIRCAWFTNCP